MRFSTLPLNTYRETPAEAEVVSHQLMLRAGLIRRLASGLFTWMPMGLRVLRKVEAIVREEMERAGAHELLMPAVQPAELWQETGRWDKYGPLLLRMQDRHNRDFCFGPTHEEVITDIARRELRSYRQLPVTWYQIQTKFRDEIRPRFGVMRAREFVMKDAYSFGVDQASLDIAYDQMAEAYSRVCERLALEYRAVEADSGEIGGARSQEFHVLAESGEDAIAFCPGDEFAANVEKAPALATGDSRPDPSAQMEKLHTPGTRTIEAVCELLDLPANRCLKTLFVDGDDGGIVALVLRGDHELNALKAQALAGVASPLQFADAEAVRSATGCAPGFVGPVGLEGIRIYADPSALAVADFTCGANEADYHLSGVNWNRDLDEAQSADIRNVVAGDPSPGGGGALEIARGIEVGHIFQLGDKYSRAMNATVLDQDGNEKPLIMGCYGIGITRMVAAAIEQNHDDDGIIWPDPMSPFEISLLALNPAASSDVSQAAEKLYAELREAGFEVLFDDRDARPGVKFADADLLGIPHRVVIGERGLRDGVIEYRHRRTGETERVTASDGLAFLKSRLS